MEKIPKGLSQARINLLNYAPDDLLLKIILETEPEHLSYICTRNYRVLQLCNKEKTNRAYRKKWPVLYRTKQSNRWWDI